MNKFFKVFNILFKVLTILLLLNLSYEQKLNHLISLNNQKNMLDKYEFQKYRINVLLDIINRPNVIRFYKDLPKK